MSFKNMDTSSLPMNAMDEVPTPNANAVNIVALVKSGRSVTGYKLSDGQILPKDAAIQLARSGGISGVGIAHNQGTEYLKSLPDGMEANNLSNLPSIIQE